MSQSAEWGVFTPALDGVECMHREFRDLSSPAGVRSFGIDFREAFASFLSPVIRMNRFIRSSKSFGQWKEDIPELRKFVGRLCLWREVLYPDILVLRFEHWWKGRKIVLVSSGSTNDSTNNTERLAEESYASDMYLADRLVYLISDHHLRSPLLTRGAEMDVAPRRLKNKTLTS